MRPALLVTAAVVGDHSLARDASSGEPGSGSRPERTRGVSGLVKVDLGVDEPGSVIEGRVDVAVADTGVTAGRAGAATVDSPAAAVGDPTNLFDVDVDQLAGPVALIPNDRLDSSVATIETTATIGIQDVLHRLRGQAGLVRDVIGTPTMLAT